MGVPGRGRRRLAVDAARRRRRHVPDAAAERRRRARREDRPGVLDLPLHAATRRRSSAAARTTAASRFSATRCSWARSTRTWSPSTRRTAGRCGTTQVAESQGRLLDDAAPLVVKDKVIVGVGGGEYGIRGFVAAYDARSGKEAWRFYTIPAPGEPGGDTWKPCPPAATTFCDPEAWKHGGGSVWVTGSYDPDAEPDLLGRRQPRSRLEPRSAARRQPLHRLGRRARRRHRQAEVALPVHAERSLRLRLGAGSGARRHHLAAARRSR